MGVGKGVKERWAKCNWGSGLSVDVVGKIRGEGWVKV
jgi:hypothetical protein